MYLPEEIKPHYIGEAEYLLNDLETNRLRVILVPAPQPMHQMHMIRVVESYNPEWYSSLYWSIDHFRRDRSLRALNRIIKQNDKPFRVQPYKYDMIYRELIHERLMNGFYEQGYEIPPNQIVKSFLDSLLEEDYIPFQLNGKKKNVIHDDVPF